MSVRPGTRLDGRYRLSERLAYGGMGEVWRATDEVLSREVAVKILRPELAEDEAFVRRFRAEARTTSGLPHNGIAAVYDYGETRVGADGQSPAPLHDDEADPVAYLVMELVPGEALSSILSRDGALSSERTLDLVAQAARALHAAHQRGVIHRDVKPANLMVTPDERVKVTDFGIARPLDHEPLTATGQVMGTAHYLAPELAKGQDASALSDVYALGVVAYECLAGHRPFEGDNQVAVALSHLNEQPPPLPGTISAQVRAVVEAAMEKDPQRRMPSAEAFAAALETLRFRSNGDGEHLTPGTGILPGSPAALGLASAGLLGPEAHGWTPGLPGGRASAGLGSPVGSGQPLGTGPLAGTHVLGPAGSPAAGMQSAMAGAGTSTGGAGRQTGGLLGSPPGGGYGEPPDPFRTPTAPGGISVTPGARPRARRRSGAGPILALAALAVAVVIVAVALWINGSLGPGTELQVPGDNSPSGPAATSSPAVVLPGVPTTTSTTSSTRRRPTTTSKSTTTSTSTSKVPTSTTSRPPTSTTTSDPPTTTTTSDPPTTTTTTGGGTTTTRDATGPTTTTSTGAPD